MEVLVVLHDSSPKLVLHPGLVDPILGPYLEEDRETILEDISDGSRSPVGSEVESRRDTDVLEG